jgi:antitoxin HicB
MNTNINELIRQPYSIIIQPGDDECFYAKVEELEGCFAEGNTVQEAWENIHETMKDWMEFALEKNITIPLPKTEEKEYSGKIIVRMPKELHKNLAGRAEKEEISLNQFIVYLLSSNLYRNQTNVLCDQRVRRYGSRKKLIKLEQK